MNDIIDSRSGRMEIETYSTIRTTKVSLKCTNLAALKYKQKRYIVRPADLTISNYMHTSSSCYKKQDKRKINKIIC